MWRRPALLALLLLLLVPAGVAAQATGDTEEDEVLVRVNGSDTIEVDERVSVAVIVNGNLGISGELTDFGMVVDGDIAVLGSARVDGTLVVTNGTLTLRDGSVMTGDIVLTGDATWVIEEGAQFTGEVNEGDFSIDFDRDVAWQLIIVTLVGWLGTTIVAVLSAVVFAGVGGRQLWTSARNLSARPGATFLSALGFWFALILLSVPMALSFVGVLAFPVLFMLGSTIWFLGYLTFGTRLGASLTGQSINDPSVDHPYLSSIAGTVVLQLVLLLAAGSALGAAVALIVDGSREGLAVALGIPALLFYVILWLVGVLGGGAIVLKAIDAWFSNDSAERSS